MNLISFLTGALIGGAITTLFLSCFRVGSEFDKQMEDAYGRHNGKND